MSWDKSPRNDTIKLAEHKVCDVCNFSDFPGRRSVWQCASVSKRGRGGAADKVIHSPSSSFLSMSH
jgi:hypothetical protein